MVKNLTDISDGLVEIEAIASIGTVTAGAVMQFA